MKARIKEEALHPSVWLYEPGEYRTPVSLVAESCGVEFHTFGPEKAGLKVKDILSENKADVSADVPPKGPVLLMDGLDKKGLDRFLTALRGQCAEKGLPSIDLKAVVTPVNRGWIFAELVRELASEHKLMHGKT